MRIRKSFRKIIQNSEKCEFEHEILNEVVIPDHIFLLISKFACLGEFQTKNGKIILSN